MRLYLEKYNQESSGDCFAHSQKERDGNVDVGAKLVWVAGIAEGQGGCFGFGGSRCVVPQFGQRIELQQGRSVWAGSVPDCAFCIKPFLQLVSPIKLNSKMFSSNRDTPETLTVCRFTPSSPA